MQEKREILTKCFLEAGIHLSDAQINAFLSYAALLEAWNQKINLTAITDFREVVQKHFLDSVYPFFLQDFSGARTLLDVGSGAGFPGIPLKILFSELQITLLDSLNKRVSFLCVLIRELELKKIQAFHGRAEDFSRQEAFREQFDLVTARAVASLPLLAEYGLPFVRVGGKFIAFKSKNVSEELFLAQNALKILGGSAEKPLFYALPGLEVGRSLLICRKTAATPTGYPRKAGTIAKKPL